MNTLLERIKRRRPITLPSALPFAAEPDQAALPATAAGEPERGPSAPLTVGTGAAEPDQAARWSPILQRLDPVGRPIIEAAAAELGRDLLEISSRPCPACSVTAMILLRGVGGSVFGCLACGRDLRSALAVAQRAATERSARRDSQKT